MSGFIYATRYHDISCGHRVFGHESKCAHLHGHNYRVHFTCRMKTDFDPQKRLDQVGRVIDFSVMKSSLCMWLEASWDHHFLVWNQDPWYKKLYEIDGTVMPVPFNPTAENMAKYLCEVIGPSELPRGVVLSAVEIEETAKCSAIYTLEDV